jgi:site-specific recombinase
MMTSSSSGLRARLARLFGSDPGRTLGELLAHSDSKMDLHERALWFAEVLTALKPRGSDETADLRLRHFFNLLAKDPTRKEAFVASLRTLFHEASFRRFFSETGYTHEHGLWAEVAGRLFARLLPKSANEDVQDIVLAVFSTERDWEWLEGMGDETVAEFAALITAATEEPESKTVILDGISEDLREALLLQSVNIAHHGLSLAVRGRLSRRRDVYDSSFLRLSAELQRAVIDPAESVTSRRFEGALARCRADIEAVYQNIERSGVSVGTVHTLEALSAAMTRLEDLLALQTEAAPEIRARKAAAFIAEAARSGDRGRSVRAHLGRHFYLLSRKIAERNGHSGEHYIARGPAENRALFLSAFGGGVIVVLMTIAKTGVLHAGLAPIFVAVGAWVVYAAGFLAMQFTGATLATKIPSFTASRLAQWIKDARTRGDVKKFRGELRTVVTSQGVALVGNVLAVIPCAWGIDLLVRAASGHSFFGEAYGEHTLADLHPVHGPALFHGVVTGAELWMSSIAGGWFENFVAFRGIPETIARHPRLRKIFGDATAKSLAEKFLAHASGIGTNISLGFLFGFVPLLGTILGLNLDGKHVTISTASATFAFASVGASTSGSAIAWTAAGLLIVGTMNFTVSFALALTVATRAQNVSRAWAWRFFRGALRV